MITMRMCFKKYAQSYIIYDISIAYCRFIHFKNNDNKLVYSYTLSSGASDVCVALDMAKQSGLFN